MQNQNDILSRLGPADLLFATLNPQALGLIQLLSSVNNQRQQQQFEIEDRARRDRLDVEAAAERQRNRERQDFAERLSVQEAGGKQVSSLGDLWNPNKEGDLISSAPGKVYRLPNQRQRQQAALQAKIAEKKAEKEFGREAWLADSEEVELPAEIGGGKVRVARDKVADFKVKLYEAQNPTPFMQAVTDDAGNVSLVTANRKSGKLMGVEQAGQIGKSKPEEKESEGEILRAAENATMQHFTSLYPGLKRESQAYKAALQTIQQAAGIDESEARAFLQSAQGRRQYPGIEQYEDVTKTPEYQTKLNQEFLRRKQAARAERSRRGPNAQKSAAPTDPRIGTIMLDPQGNRVRIVGISETGKPRVVPVE